MKSEQNQASGATTMNWILPLCGGGHNFTPALLMFPAWV